MLSPYLIFEIGILLSIYQKLKSLNISKFIFDEILVGAQHLEPNNISLKITWRKFYITNRKRPR